MSIGDEARARLNDEVSQTQEAIVSAEAHWLLLKGWIDEFSKEFAGEASKLPYRRNYHEPQAPQTPKSWFARRLMDLKPKVWEVHVGWCGDDSSTDLNIAIDTSGGWSFLGSGSYYLNRFLAGEFKPSRGIYDRSEVRREFVARLKHLIELS
ncbi:hypothetical protein [Cryobacterium sp. Y50]|uniref:hypothetical protein n=1 Tax=Cryobacterium sp. Y50 TaxID=2048286 RepID=UPI0011AFD89B|nr:hypothetical protein [Cryobacterium sp. Y50]